MFDKKNGLTKKMFYRGSGSDRWVGPGAFQFLAGRDEAGQGVCKSRVSGWVTHARWHTHVTRPRIKQGRVCISCPDSLF